MNRTTEEDPRPARIGHALTGLTILSAVMVGAAILMTTMPADAGPASGGCAQTLSGSDHGGNRRG